METEYLLSPPHSRVLKSGRVVLLPGESIGEHVTDNREELIIVLRGSATLVKGNQVIELIQGETHYINENISHNVFNNSNKELEYVYVVSLFR